MNMVRHCLSRKESPRRSGQPRELRHDTSRAVPDLQWALSSADLAVGRSVVSYGYGCGRAIEREIPGPDPGPAERLRSLSWSAAVARRDTDPWTIDGDQRLVTVAGDL